MWTSRIPSGDRREESRRATYVHADMRTTDVRPVSPIDALIEERGERGVRLRSDAPLLPDAVVILQLHGEKRPLHARVVWARREGVPGWRAGCRLLGGEPVKAEPGRADLVREPRAGRTVAVAGLVALGVLLVYALVRFATAMGEAAVSR